MGSPIGFSILISSAEKPLNLFIFLSLCLQKRKNKTKMLLLRHSHPLTLAKQY